jgi:uncharacterized protein YkwD
MTASRSRADALGMRRTQRSVLAIALTGLVLAGAGLAGAAQSSTSVRLTTLDQTLLVRINVLRRAHALAPLRLSAALSSVADEHTTEMGRAGYFAHTSFDHTSFWKRIERSYLSSGHRSWSVGENLLFASPTVGAGEAVRMWMNSPAHRKIMLDPTWREIGIAGRHFDSAPGIYNGEEVTILTTDFGIRR